MFEIDVPDIGLIFVANVSVFGGTYGYFPSFGDEFVDNIESKVVNIPRSVSDDDNMLAYVRDTLNLLC